MRSQVMGDGRSALLALLFSCATLQCEAFSLCPRAAFERLPISTSSTSRGWSAGVAATNLGRAAASGHFGQLRAEAGLGVQGTERSQEASLTEDDTQDTFQWTRQWYPIAVIRDLEARDPRQPYPVQLLGEPLVVWKDPKGGWKAFADRCPHRWAPLSEGRVDLKTGRLQCIYHGWEFEGDGKCGSIPQADPAIRENAQNSKRACATVIPARVVQGKLWLWPDSSPEGVAASERVSPAVVDDLDTGEFGGNWYARDLPYGFDTLIENLVDPAHVPFAHHGVIGSRAMGTPMNIVIDDEAGTGEDAFVTKLTGFLGINALRVGFEAPGLIYYKWDYSGILPSMIKRMRKPVRAMAWGVKKLNLDRRLSMKEEDRKEYSDIPLNYFIGYAVPTSPGRSRIFTRTARNFFLQHPVIPRRWRNSIAKEHLAQHLVLDGDGPLLHAQERFLADADQQGVKRPESTYFMPAAADAPVRAFRKWYNSRGGSGPQWAKGVDPSDLGPTLSREEAIDRLHTHTKDCSACNKAYQVSGKVKKVAGGGAVLLLAAAAAAPRGRLALGLVGGALANAGLAIKMAKREQKFIFLDYVHYHRD